MDHQGIVSDTLPPFTGVLAEYTVRGGHFVHRLRLSSPAVNQPALDTVAGRGSADYEAPHGNA